jgi:hypothetical protein
LNFFTRKFRAVYELFSVDHNSLTFKKHLRKTESLNGKATNSLVLIEFEQSPENVIALSLFLPILAETFDASFAAFQTIGNKRSSSLTGKIRYRFSTSRIVIGRKLFQIQTLKDWHRESDRTNSIKFETKEELERFVYRNIWIGDLIYDEYLAKHDSPTVDLQDVRLHKIVSQAVDIADWWINLHETTKVEAIIVSHDVYLFGIPARYMACKGIPVYLVSTGGVSKLSEKFFQIGARVIEYPKEFKRLPLATQQKGCELAKNKIHGRLKGVRDLHYMPVDVFGESDTNEFFLKKTTNKRILIAAHDFYDSPHGGALHFYPDFYEWMNRLGKISEETNYDWYIKTHPFLRGRGREILAEITESFPKLVLLPPNVTHNQIISEGIDLALTVYGTIATEYPLFGIPVLNASSNNPHQAYNFSITPKNRQEYEFLLRNLELIPRHSIPEEIYEYYFMHNILPIKNWVFLSDEKYKQDTGFGFKPMTREIYSYFIKTDNKIGNIERDEAIRSYLRSGDNLLNRGHFDRNSNSGIDRFWQGST